MDHLFKEPGIISLKKQILIVGCGAMGCVFAARFCAAGFPVDIVDEWEEGILAIREHGISLKEPGGSTNSFFPRNVTLLQNQVALPASPVTFALVMLKSWQTERAIRLIKEQISPEGLVLTLQNGLGNLEIIQNILGEDRAACGVTTLGASLLSPGHASLNGEGLITLGPHPKFQAIASIFKEAGFNLEYEENLPLLRWQKLAVNAAINPLTAILGVSNGFLGEDASCQNLVKLLVEETILAAKSIGMYLEFTPLLSLVQDVITRTKRNQSSMLQDLNRGAPTEIEAITGEILKHASRSGLNLPVSLTIYQLMQAAVTARKEKGNQNVNSQ